MPIVERVIVEFGVSLPLNPADRGTPWAKPSRTYEIRLEEGDNLLEVQEQFTREAMMQVYRDIDRASILNGLPPVYRPMYSAIDTDLTVRPGIRPQKGMNVTLMFGHLTAWVNVTDRPLRIFAYRGQLPAIASEPDVLDAARIINKHLLLAMTPDFGNQEPLEAVEVVTVEQIWEAIDELNSTQPKVLEDGQG